MIKRYETSGSFKLSYRELGEALPKEAYYKDFSDAYNALASKKHTALSLHYIPVIRNDPIVVLWSKG